MKIFLSYASPDRPVAEAIQLTLLGAGNEVFFDEASLPPGSDYNSRIREAINKSDVFIFLISPNSVTHGRYVQAELKFAKTKWPKPWGVVLPVLIAPTEYKLIDPYLAAVTILEPRGSAPAEIAAAVLTLRTSADTSSSTTEGGRAVVEGAKFRASPDLEVVQQDILRSSGGLLVCPVNSTLIMSDGLQREVRRLVGARLQLKLLRYAFRFPLGDVRVERGNDTWPYIALANSAGEPRRRARSEKNAIAQIVSTALGKAEALNLDVVHLPLLGARFGKLADELSFNQIRSGLARYKEDHPACNIAARLYIHDPERFIAIRTLWSGDMDTVKRV